jgi:hypothetical protein
MRSATQSIASVKYHAERGYQNSMDDKQIFLSIVGQGGAERPNVEELSWLM